MKINDYVKILNQQQCYPRYASFIASHRFELLDNFTLGEFPDIHSTYIIEFIEDYVCIIRDLQNDKIYVINENGLENVTSDNNHEINMLRSLESIIERVLSEVECEKYEYLQENLGYTLNTLEGILN